MDLQDQLKDLFPDHIPSEHINKEGSSEKLWVQEAADESSQAQNNIYYQGGKYGWKKFN